MRILILHVQYKISGGEDSVVLNEASLLGKNNMVKVLKFKNKSGLAGAFQYLGSIFNVFKYTAVIKEIKEFNPQVVHIHNLHFALGPLVIWAAKKKNIPVIFTLHNYRLLCPSAILLNKNKIFTDSIGKAFPWKAVKLKLYRNSYFQTFWLAFSTWFHKKIGTWAQVNKYIVLTDFAQQLFSSLPFTRGRLIVKPNFVDRTPGTSSPRGKNFLFVGRLTEEKGINTLIGAFQNSEHTLEIVGAGDMKNYVASVSEENENIIYSGVLGKEEVLQKMCTCDALIFPSIWFEGMPMTIIEAFSTGTAVIANNLGAMSTMIVHGVNGLHFDTTAEDLRHSLDFWCNMPEEKKYEIRREARRTYEERYAPEINYTQLLDIYKSAIK